MSGSGVLTFMFMVRATFPIWAGLSLTAVALTTTLSSQGNPADPFAPYADLMPGQPADSLESDGFHCVMDSFPTNLKVQCSRLLSEEAVSQIHLTVSSKIVRTTFAFYENRVVIGDLMLLLGKPIINSHGSIISLDWPEIHVRAVAQMQNGHLSYRNMVMFVTFE